LAPSPTGQHSEWRATVLAIVHRTRDAALDHEWFSDLLGGGAAVADLTQASPAEMIELLSAAESARRSIKKPSQWNDPASGNEFTVAYDGFLEVLRADRRITTSA